MKNDIASMEKGFVVDTSALMDNPDIVDRVPGAVFIPLTVIKQLDGLKNNSDLDVSKQARSASFFIERAIKERRVAILTEFNRIDGLDNESDNRIVGAAVWLQENNPFADVVLVTTDRNMRIVGDGYGLNSIADQDAKSKKDSPKWRSVLTRIGIVLVCFGFLAIIVALLTPLLAMVFSAEACIFVTISGFFAILAGIMMMVIWGKNIKGKGHRFDPCESDSFNTGSDLTLPVVFQDKDGLAWRYSFRDD